MTGRVSAEEITRRAREIVALAVSVVALAAGTAVLVVAVLTRRWWQ